MRTGRCETFAEAAASMAERRRQLLELAGRFDVLLGATGTHPWSPWQEQRIIDTPHYRRNDEILRYVVWRNNSFGLHVHVGIRGADRAIRVTDALRTYLPHLLAYSGSSPFVEGVYTYLHSARTQIFTRMFPRCGIPDAFGSWAEYERYVRFLYDTGSITEHTQLWWSVRPHLGFPTVEIRICDGQPDLAEAQSLAALMYALTARIARAVDEGEPLPDHPPRLLEENLWRAIRHGLSGELIDLDTGDGASRPRRDRAADRVEPSRGRGARRLVLSHGPRGERVRAPDGAPRGGRVPGGDLRPGDPGAGPCLRPTTSTSSSRRRSRASSRTSCASSVSRTSSSTRSSTSPRSATAASA